MRFARFEPLCFKLRDGSVRKRLRVAFIWKGPDDDHPVRHRESTGLDDNRENRRRWKPKLLEIERELILTNCGQSGPFDPSRWFPMAVPITPTSSRITVGDFARRYLEELRGAKLIEQTRKHYEEIFSGHILRSNLAKVPLDQLDDGHLKVWLADLQEMKLPNGKRLQPSTVNKILARVRTMVTLAWKRELIPRRINPMELVDNVQMVRSAANPFTPNELLAIFAVCKGQQRALYVTLALTGLRPSEGLGLTHEYVDLRGGGPILVRQQLREDGTLDARLKTPRSRREVVMFEPVRAALVGLAPQNRLRSKFVFANAAGGPLLERSQGDHPWRHALERAGVEYRPLKNLRHTFTTLMLGANKPVQWVAHQLGHADIKKICEVYGRWLHTPPDERLDLDLFFQSIMRLPPTVAKSRPILPKSGPSAKSENADTAKSA